MSGFRKAAAGAALATVAALAGCGNQTDQGLVFKSLMQSVSGDTGQAAAMTPEQTAAAVETSLAQTDLPLALATIEQREAVAILANIESNGPYRTWGTSDRRTITTRNGIVTATRGLGNDIMSSAIGGVEPLIVGRKAGSASHVLRFLDGENRTVEVVAECQVTRGSAARVSGGMLKGVAAVEMRESCTYGGGKFTNTYLVEGSGRVVQSRQWLGAANGDIAIQLLR